jgi:hypothetical protein
VGLRVAQAETAALKSAMRSWRGSAIKVVGLLALNVVRWIAPE